MTDPHLARVTSRIGLAVLAFAAAHHGESWHMDELRQFIEQQVGTVAPASPDRVLRQLRAKRALNYQVLNRRASLYQWQPVPVPTQQELGL